jgi:uncharacterized membrane protein YgcG
MPIPVQPPDVDQASWYAANCWPSLPRDRIPGIFAFSQIGEILTVRAPRDGEDWMRLNAREEEQRWNILNSTMAVLSTSRETKDRSTLEQFQSLVQPTQFLEQVRRTWPMSETQLDAVTSVHEMRLRRLDALDVLNKGGQNALDKFMGMTLTGMERKKALAIAKGKKSEVWNKGNNGNNGPSRKRARRRGGGGAGSGGGVSVGGGASGSGGAGGGQQNAQSFQGGQKQGLVCSKCRGFGHKTEDCCRG